MQDTFVITGLKKLFESEKREGFTPWVQQNSLLINHMQKHNLVFGGSIAMAITRKKIVKMPGDIDLFTNSNEDAMGYVTDIAQYLAKKPGSFYRIGVNNQTKWCMEGVRHHYRIDGPPYWKKICIMVLEKPIRYFIWNGVRVQFFDDVVASAKEATAKDGKERVNLGKILDNSEKSDHCEEDDDDEFYEMKNDFDLDAWFLKKTADNSQNPDYWEDDDDPEYESLLLKRREKFLEKTEPFCHEMQKSENYLTT